MVEAYIVLETRAVEGVYRGCAGDSCSVGVSRCRTGEDCCC